jgi:hypothetical protein
MKANRVLQQLNAESAKLAAFVKTAKKERTARTQVHPITGETVTVEAKPAKKATPIITINEKNQIFFNQEVIDLYGMNGLLLTIANVEGTNYFVLTEDFDKGFAGIAFRTGNSKKGYSNVTNGKKATADVFVQELRNMENGYSNNFLLEEVDVDVQFVTGIKKVFKIKLNKVK